MTARRRALAAVALSAALAVVVGIQFLRPVVSSSPGSDPRRVMSAHVAVPADVDSVLRRACYDCHSYETRWPAYARVAPASWLLQADVLSARASLNFSDWDTDPEREPTPSQRLRGICSDVRKRVMPPRTYLALHPAARLSERDVARLCEWAEGARAGAP